MRKNESPFWPQKSILNPPPPKEPVEPVRRVRMTLTREEQRLIDKAASSDYQVPVSILMEHAGLAVANACTIVAKALTTPIHFFAGKGMNGGDSYVAARLLKSWGYQVTIWDCFPGETQSPTVKNNRAAAEKFGVPIKPASEFDPKIEEGHSRGARVIAIDIPTGVDCNTGEADPGAITADLTVSFVLPKKGITVLPGRAKAAFSLLKFSGSSWFATGSRIIFPISPAAASSPLNTRLPSTKGQAMPKETW